MGKILNIVRGTSLVSIHEAMNVVFVQIDDGHALIAETVSDIALLKTAILALPADQRTYSNTILAYDELCGIGVVLHALTSVIRCVSSDVARRDAPYEQRKQEMGVLLNDPALYAALKEYIDGPMTHEILTSEQQQYIEILIQQGKRSGFDQPEEARWELAALKKQMDAAASAFESNYNADVTVVSIAETDLRGVDASFVRASPRDEQGNLLILCNSVSWNAIMPYCSTEHVRRMFYQAYYKRAYPANGESLQRLLHARTVYAQALGYADYASYMLEVCMLSTSDQVLIFLQDFIQAAKPLFTSFITEVSQNIPEGVALIECQLKPWDVAFTLADFKNRTCGLDQREVSQYFPIQAVMSGMLKVYALFMGVSFEFQEKFANTWDEAVQGVTVFNHDKTRILGYIFFDLLPRPQKYSHACCWQIIPRVRRHDPQTGILYETPGIATIIANIPLPQQDAPSLLYHDTVRTLFHEFGHALHAVLSCTSHFQTSGLKGVMRDYVELPSQILEEWIWKPEILRMLSAHYETGEPLPDDLISRLIASRTVEQGFFEMNQARRALYSLRLFIGDGTSVDIDAELEKVHKECLPGILWDPENKEYASFGHLVPYGPRYFGYILSRIYARDVFAHIEPYGLLNAGIGACFVGAILRPGGSKHPLKLLEAFLKRPVSCKAYFDTLTQIIKK